MRSLASVLLIGLAFVIGAIVVSPKVASATSPPPGCAKDWDSHHVDDVQGGTATIHVYTKGTCLQSAYTITVTSELYETNWTLIDDYSQTGTLYVVVDMHTLVSAYNCYYDGHRVRWDYTGGPHIMTQYHTRLAQNC